MASGGQAAGGGAFRPGKKPTAKTKAAKKTKAELPDLAVVPVGPGHITRLLVRNKRRQGGVKHRLFRPVWKDPYPEVPGTIPEKMIYAQLKQRQVEFVFQALGFPPEHPNGPHFRPNLGEIRPDILIPSVRAAIEVQGTYFHTQPDTEAHDLDKVAEYHAWGWYAYWLFDLDILVAPARALELAPEVSGFGPILGLLLPKAKKGAATQPGATTADANAVAAANRARARPQFPGLVVRRNRGRRRTRVITDGATPAPLLKPVVSNLTATQKQSLLRAQAPEPSMKPAPPPPSFFTKQRKAKKPIGPFG